ncbi:amino acid adenylation domain protein [Methyloversatilis sp. RAC08]|uniref:amino acid adenylation domain-containing protein n=1 Tax=Methyloversatilis sp. RAC08 TaxID=1842540 RepID=UPI0008565735|nr:non-ribosomal peptide synthetase [Methyloversatilis sp. RAC08]AOF82829.1 amino acid adenylation domain protein [Methyloversatilis sp. RAC08]
MQSHAARHSTISVRPQSQWTEQQDGRREDRQPCSWAQSRLWFLEQWEPGTSLYHIVQELEVRGPLDVTALQNALDALVARHESLRTGFIEVAGEPAQRIVPSARCVLSVQDLRSIDAPERARALASRMQSHGAHPFDLGTPPLMRVALWHVGQDEHVLQLVIHHIGSDGWSQGVLNRELGALYSAALQGGDARLPDLPVQYADYALWQRETLSGPILQKQLDYWRTQLADLPLLALPTDHARPAQPSYRGAVVPFEIATELTSRLRGLGRDAGGTLYMVLLAAFKVLLARASGHSDIAVGTPVAGRGQVELETLIGFFVNTLVLRTKLPIHARFREVLEHVRETALGAFDHAQMPFEKLVEALRPVRDPSRNPLFQVMFSLQNTPHVALELDGAHCHRLVRESGIAKFDLTLELTETADGLSGLFEYATDLFDERRVRLMAGHFQTLLESVVAQPDTPISRLPLLTSAEQQRMLVQWNATQTDYPRDATLASLFEAQVARTPDAIALVCAEQSLTYTELNARANRIAHALRAHGVGPDVMVGLHLQRSIELVTGLLGIVKAGGAYVPLDPAYPVARLAYMLQDTAAPVVLTQHALMSKLPRHPGHTLCVDDHAALDQQPDDNPLHSASSENLAYVIYTSGSTGQPKGVMVSHAAVSNRMHWLIDTFGISDVDGILMQASINFDVSVGQLFACLFTGGRCVIALDDERTDSAALVELTRVNSVSIWDLTPSTLRPMLDEPGVTACAALRHVFCGGEVLDPSLAHTFRSRTKATLHNVYGPTETTIDATCRTIVGTEQNSIPIGRPIANTEVFVLDASRQPVPVGVEGELYIGGAGLARGYLGRPDLTSEKFVAHPFSDRPGARLYRTGDRVRWLHDGNIEFLGRFDQQIKLRGFRIEPGEIEAALTTLPAVNQATVMLREDRPGETRLVAYVAGDSIEPTRLRAQLALTLPAHMLPSSFIVLDAFPITPNGKLDRDKLPKSESSLASDDYAAPRTPIEEALTDIWADTLGLQRMGIHDHFFELGGHSLLAAKLVSRLRSVFNCNLTPRSVFDAPTIEGMARLLQKARTDGISDAIPPVARPFPAPVRCSFAQSRLWFLEQWEPGTSLYHIVQELEVRGPLDVTALQNALDALVARHESLRTGFIEVAGEPAQRIVPSARCVLSVQDLRSIDAPERARALASRMQSHGAHPFDLGTPPLMRVALWHVGQDEHVLQLVIHHIGSDGWSQGVLNRELGALYSAALQGGDARLPDLPVQYADYALWQRETLSGPILQKQLDYWRTQLADLPLLALPTDHARPAQPSYRGAVVPFEIATELTSRLRGLGRDAGGTLYMVLLAAFKVLLARASGHSDIAVGTPVAGRGQVELETLIGFFVNTLVLRTKLPIHARFREVLEHVRETALGAFDHAQMPFEKLVEALRPVRDPSRNPLFQVMFSLQNTPHVALELDGAHCHRLVRESGIAKFDLTLELTETADGLSGLFEYATDLFDERRVRLMAGHFQTLLESVVAQPDTPISRLPLLTSAEQQRMLVQWNATQTDYPRDATLASLFEAQVARTPDAIALVCAEQSLTYTELNARANRIAHALRAHGVGPDVMVGLHLQRSIELVTGLLGIVKAGGAYVPLDPAYPVARLAYMLQDTAAPVVLTQHALMSKLPRHPGHTLCVDDHAALDQQPDDNPLHSASSENLAYVIYTSGSTGQPKGVMVEQRNVARLVCHTDYASFGPEETFLQLAPMAFDASTFEVWGALLHGARCVIYPDELPTAAGLEAVISRNGVTTLWLTAALFNAVIDERPEALRGLRLLLTGGEALSVAHVQRALDALPGVQLINGYGPTESTTFTCCHRIPSGLLTARGSIPIGRPIANTEVFVLDASRQPVPVGVEGELYIGGAGLARGYLGRPDLTSEKFVAHPFSDRPGARLYRTGDRVRWLHDGNIEFLGRFDQQIKLRGFRIEPGEIEAALTTLPAVNQATVMLREDRPGETRLVAYVAGDSIEPTRLRAQLALTLPAHMLPSSFIVLDAFPITPNGKLDRDKLPPPQDSPRAKGIPSSPDTGRPGDIVERHLLGIWESLFERSDIGLDQDFFEIGGHSLMAVRLVDAIARTFGERLPLDTLWFRGSSIRDIAAAVRSQTVGTRWPLLVPIKPGGDKPPLFCVHTIGGNLFHYFELARALSPRQPVFGLNARGAGGRETPHHRLADIAADCVASMREAQPYGPYRLAGFSSGGTVAFEMAQQLSAAGETVSVLALLDTYAPGVHLRPRGPGVLDWLRCRVRPYMNRQRLAHAALSALGRTPSRGFPDAASAHWWAHWGYHPSAYSGEVDLYLAEESLREASEPSLGWSTFVTHLSVHNVPGTHGLMVKPPLVNELARQLQNRLDEAETMFQGVAAP